MTADTEIASGDTPPFIARWDLDKTYLRTEFDTLRDLVRTGAWTGAELLGNGADAKGRTGAG